MPSPIQDAEIVHCTRPVPSHVDGDIRVVDPVAIDAHIILLNIKDHAVHYRDHVGFRLELGDLTGTRLSVGFSNREAVKLQPVDFIASEPFVNPLLKLGPEPLMLGKKL